MTKFLQVAPDHRLPVEVISDSIAILGRKRSGKSNNAVVIVEEALDLLAQVVILDPKGDWWGMLSSADGKTAGYPLVVIGGRHATIELNPYAGAAVADWIIDTGHSVIVDVSQLAPADLERFCDALLYQLRRRREEKPSPLLLVIDEADELAPEDQRDRLAVLKTLGRVIWMVKRGGFIGIGTLVVTQRPASLNKNVLTQTEVLIVLNVTGSQDIDAIALGVKHHIKAATRKERAEKLDQLLSEIVSLAKGEAIVVSGQLLKGISRIQFRRRKTFDSGATPKFGEKQRAPKVVAKVALEQLSAAMAKAVAEAKANDPDLLKKRIRELETTMKAEQFTHSQAIVTLETKLKNVKPAEKLKPVAVLKDGQVARLEAALKTWNEALEKMTEKLVAARDPLLIALAKVSAPSAAPSSERSARSDAGSNDGAAVRAGAHMSERSRSSASTRGAVPRADVSGRPSAVPARTTTIDSNGKISPGAQRVLNAVAYLDSIGVQDPTPGRVAAMAGASPKLSTWRGYLSELRGKALLEGLRLTAAGQEAAHVAEVPTTTIELHNFARQKLSVGAQRGLTALLEAYPGWLDRAQVAEACGVDPGISTFRGYIAELNKFGYLESSARSMRAASFLFMEG